MKHRIEKIGKCKYCNATGLYVGIGEGKGIATVCNQCEGTGKKTYVLEWEDFKTRKYRKDIKIVIQTNPGIGLNMGDNFGGISYEEWLSSGMFPIGKEDRLHTCPAWFYQSADYSKKPNWDECRGFGAFSSCPSFCTKDGCWKRWDKEYNV